MKPPFGSHSTASPAKRAARPIARWESAAFSSPALDRSRRWSPAIRSAAPSTSSARATRLPAVLLPRCSQEQPSWKQPHSAILWLQSQFSSSARRERHRLSKFVSSGAKSISRNRLPPSVVRRYLLEDCSLHRRRRHPPKARLLIAVIRIPEPRQPVPRLRHSHQIVPDTVVRAVPLDDESFFAALRVIGERPVAKTKGFDVSAVAIDALVHQIDDSGSHQNPEPHRRGPVQHGHIKSHARRLLAAEFGYLVREHLPGFNGLFRPTKGGFAVAQQGTLAIDGPAAQSLRIVPRTA